MSNSRRPPSRRNTEYALQQHERALQAMVPGTLAGRMASAGPVWQVGGATITAEGNDGLGGGAFGSSLDVFKNDEQFVTVSGTDTFTLEFVPVPGSVHVSLNGLNLTRDSGSGGEYTVNGKDIILDATADAGVGWDVDVHYVYRSDFDDVPTDNAHSFFDLVMSLGPLAYWRLGDVSNGGTMTDSSGHAHHGTWNSVTSHTPTVGLVANDGDQALLMTGAGGEGAHVTSAAWMNLTSNLSWLIFFKTTDTAARLFAREQTSGGGQDWSLQVGNNVFFCAGGSVVATSVDNTLSDDAMHMAVFTYDGSNVRIYIDGAIDKTQAYSTPLGTSAQDILIGYGGGIASGHMFAGTLDEAIIFDQVLSGADVTNLWDAAQ